MRSHRGCPEAPGARTLRAPCKLDSGPVPDGTVIPSWPLPSASSALGPLLRVCASSIGSENSSSLKWTYTDVVRVIDLSPDQLYSAFRSPKGGDSPAWSPALVGLLSCHSPPKTEHWALTVHVSCAKERGHFGWVGGFLGDL